MGLDAVISQLTFRERFPRRRARFERRAGALVLQIEGESDPVRQWLADLLKRYRGIVPVNNPSDVEPGQGKESQIVEQLQAIVEGCGYGGIVAHGLPIVFPRFAAARTALYDWQSTPEHFHARRIGDLKGQIKEAVSLERRRTLPEARPRLEPLVQDPYVTQQLGGLPGLLLLVVNALRLPHHRTVRWYRTRRFRGLRTFEAVCVELDSRRRAPSRSPLA